jgi:hypothetical protein
MPLAIKPISALTLTICLLSFVLTVHALYSQTGPVTLLNPRTFNERIRNSKHAAMVEFFAPWYDRTIVS